MTPGNCRSIVRVRNPGDRLCLARAILLGLAHWRSIQPVGGGGANAFRAYAQQQHRHGPEARCLLRRAGLSRRKYMYGLDDVHQMQCWIDQHFNANDQQQQQQQQPQKEIRLVVLEKERQYRIIYKGAGAAAK